MNTRMLRFQGTVASRSEASAKLRAPGDAVLVERVRPRLLLLSCPCGCGEVFPINLDERSGPAWRLYTSQHGITLFPSVWRESGCRSHYIIWRDRILLLDEHDEEFEMVTHGDPLADLTKEVLARLPAGGLVAFAELATMLGEIPWDVLTACRRLVGRGLAREGTGDQRGGFGKV
jgi:hypothetical protein